MSTKRYGALTTKQKVALVALFLAVQVVSWAVLYSPGARLSVAVLTAAVLAVAVKTRKAPAR